MPKTKLTSNEFAVEEGSKFQVKSQKIALTDSGELTLTITYKISDIKNIQKGAGDIKAFSCGVFTQKSTLTKGSIGDVYLITGSKEVFFRSPKNEIDIQTDGEKGNHGQLIFALKEVKKRSKRKHL